MQIEIPDELAERIKDVLEYGVERGYYSEVPGDAGIEKILESLVAEDEKKLGLVPRQKQVKEHNCAENMRYSSGFEIIPTGVIARGECEVCGRGLVMTCVYQDTRDSHTDEVIDVCEKPFVEASVWRGMNANTIIASIMAGLDVLHDTCIGDDHQKKQLRALIEKMENMLKVEEWKRKHEKRG